MVSKIEKKIITEFLSNNYPIVRVKEKSRFKRAIMFDNGVSYFISDKAQMFALKSGLVLLLSKAFSRDEQTLTPFVNEFLGYKR